MPPRMRSRRRRSQQGRILIKDAIADITLQQVLTRPEEFDVIATLNLNGDYLSDALAAQVGGIGIAPGGNINYVTGHAVFEATHGTAPKYANHDKVNPSSVVLSRRNDAALPGLGRGRRSGRCTAMERGDRSKTRHLRFRAADGRRDRSQVHRVRRRLDPQHALSESLAAACSAAIVAAFARYNSDFRAITRRAPERFESRDSAGSQADVVERLELYATAVNATVADMRKRLGDSAHDTTLWAGIKADYLRRIESLADPEFLKTFFSSITRRLLRYGRRRSAVEFFALEVDPLRQRQHRGPDRALRQPWLARPAVRGTALRLPLPHALA